MPTACIHTPGSKISLESGRLAVTVPAGEENAAERSCRRDIPIRDLERLILGEGVSATMPSLMEMLRRGIPVSFMDGQGRFLGSFLPAAPDHGAARMKHYQRSLEPDFVLGTSMELVSAKIQNQRRVLQRVAANRRAEDRDVPGIVEDGVDALERCSNALVRAENLESLRGFEGRAAACYFPAWAALFPAEFKFERRSTRPPLNPVNAVLSFAATLVYQETHSHIHAHGLDAALGLLHSTENGRWSLALDLMEPFRPVIAEALTLDLFSHRMLNHSHFETRDGGVFLNREGRGKLLLQYEKRMDRQFLSESAGHRTTLRQQLENHAVRFKAALDTPGSFRAFRMN